MAILEQCLPATRRAAVSKPEPSVLARVLLHLDAAMVRARARSDLRRRLRIDANIRRDIGVTRFDMRHLTDRA